MGEIIAFTSGKGGVGKTTVTANIGAGMALAGKKALLVDNDLGLRNLDAVLGLENRIVYDLLDVLAGNCGLSQAVIRHPRYRGLHLLPAAQTKDKTAVTPEEMLALVRDAAGQYDFVLMDSPAGIEHGFRNALAGADRAVVVTVPEVTAVRDASQVAGLLRQREGLRLSLVVNRFRGAMARRGQLMGVDDIVHLLDLELLGVIPEDDAVLLSSNQGEAAVGGRTAAARAYQDIARQLMGQGVPGEPAQETVLQGWRRVLLRGR